MVGMMAQEMATTCPEMREACGRELRRWTDNVARLLAAAKERHRPGASFDPKAVAWFLNSVWQGSMLIAKTSDESALIAANLRQARAFVERLFEPVSAPPAPGNP
jgi:TetR/AcrR family transcriptional repressor of nem operon